MSPRRRAGVGAVVLAAGVLAAACTSAPAPRSTASTVAPTSTAAAAAGGGPAVPCSTDDKASYRPTGALPAAGSMPAGSTMERIAQRGKLRIGVSADTLLFGARNPINGQVEGFDIDMAREVARAIFGDPDRVEVRVITYGQRIPSLEAGDVDLVAHTMTINSCRWEKIAFSTEYYTSSLKLLVKLKSGSTGMRDARTGTVCVAAGSTNLEEMQKTYPDVPRKEVVDLTDCLVLFQQGKVDAITGDDTVLAGFAAQDPYAEILAEELTTEPYGLGMNKDQVDFVRFVNGVLDRMRADGTWEEIYSRWLSDAFGEAADPPQPEYGRGEQGR